VNLSETGKIAENITPPTGSPILEGSSGMEQLKVQDDKTPQSVEGGQYDPQSDTTKIPTINSGLEGSKHPVTGVHFNSDTVELPNGRVVEGVFPEFEPVAEVQLEPNENGDYQGTRENHESAANQGLKEQIANNPELGEKFTPEQLEQIENGETPDGYTWHHHQEPGRMQLVDQTTHNATAHTGGYSLWGKDS
jgi:hypothetical protein